MTTATYGELAAASIASYYNEADANRLMKTHGAIRVRLIKSGDHEALWVEFKDKVIVAFRGTEFSWREWILNFIAFTHKTDYGKIHTGFQAAWGTLRIRVENAVESVTKPIYLTGHSLGGAIALIAAAELRAVGVNIEITVTFGSPRVSTTKICDHVGRHIRVTNAGDPVPFTPLPPYRHDCLALKLRNRKFSFGKADHPMREYWLRLVRYGLKDFPARFKRDVSS